MLLKCVFSFFQLFWHIAYSAYKILFAVLGEIFYFLFVYSFLCKISSGRRDDAVGCGYNSMGTTQVLTCCSTDIDISYFNKIWYRSCCL